MSDITELTQGLTEIAERYQAQGEAMAELQESYDEVRAALAVEDRGWALIGQYLGGEQVDGFSLEDIKDLSEKIKPHVVGDSLSKRGVDLHSGYVWGKGFNLSDVERQRGASGRPSREVLFYENDVNKESIFSFVAQEELQKARYTDGNVFLLCDLSKREVRRVPLSEITGTISNPEFPSEVWAYQRTWTNPQKSGKDKTETRWYYTPRYKGTKKKSIQKVQVSDQILVDAKFNRQVGFMFGVPDAVASLPWSAAYTEIIQYGRVVNESLAKILYKITSGTSKGVKSAGVKVAGAEGHGLTASMASGQDLTAVSTAGKGYDFVSARPVAAMAASALNVSVVELLSDSSAAGSSYGAAQTLSPSTRNAMRLMQGEWIKMYRDILDVFGLKIERLWFEPMDDPDPYRSAQQLVLLANYLHPEEVRGKALDQLDIPGAAEDIPETLQRIYDGVQAPETSAAPGQGQGNGTGGQGSTASNDVQSDTISSESVLRNMQAESLIDRLEGVLAKLEEAGLSA